MEVNIGDLEKTSKPQAAEYRIKKTQVCSFGKLLLIDSFSLFKQKIKQN